jgi:hypothetical protein
MTRHIGVFIFILSVALVSVMFIGGNNFASAIDTKPVIVDDFESGAITNALGGRTNVFLKAPSKAMVTFRKDTRQGKPITVLMLRYDKKAEGGPNDMGGWCGYYTLLKKSHPPLALQGASPAEVEEEVYFDGSQFNAITLWVKGDKGNENFVLGVADAHWDKIGDSVKSQEIGKYLPSGKVTTDWQKAVVPLDEFFIDYSKLSSIAISFESDCFPEGAGLGTIYLDDIALE